MPLFAWGKDRTSTPGCPITTPGFERGITGKPRPVGPNESRAPCGPSHNAPASLGPNYRHSASSQNPRRVDLFGILPRIVFCRYRTTLRTAHHAGRFLKKSFKLPLAIGVREHNAASIRLRFTGFVVQSIRGIFRYTVRSRHIGRERRVFVPAPANWKGWAPAEVLLVSL